LTRTDRYRNSQGLIWLNVASSTYALKDFVNLDNHVFLWLSRLPPVLTSALPKKYRDYIGAYREAARIGPMLKHDCRKPLPLPDNVADHILCSHFLEHIYPDECMEVLKDFHRVLKPGATLQVIVPDIALQAETYVRRKTVGEEGAADAFIKDTLLTTETRGSARYRVLEGLGAFGLQHRWMYDQQSISGKVAQAGFEIVDDNDMPSKTFREGDDSVHVVARKVQAR
jgi:predicted SAM-dependent methyltransferase